MQTATQRARIEGTTVFRKSIKPPANNNLFVDVLKPGNNNKKLGYKITKGRWKGKYLYSLTLEERATCPRYCHHWEDCYGNNMPFAHRYAVSPDLLPAIHGNIIRLRNKHPQGIVVRLHVLGDFYSPAYVTFWEHMLDFWPNLCIFGYTARWGDDTQYAIHTQLNRRYPNRCVIRYSRNLEYDETLTARYAADGTFDGTAFTCPEQTGKAASCADCGLCWSDGATKTVRFLSH
mgnify:CR=1 FL=1